MNNNNNEIEIDLLRLVKAIWKKAWAVGIVTVLCGALAFCITVLLITPMYQSSVGFYIYNKDNESVGTGAINNSDIAVVEKLANTYTAIIRTRSALEMIIEEAGVDYTPNQLNKMITAAAVNNTSVYNITVESDDPEEAAVIANAIANTMPSHVIGIMGGGVMNMLDEARVPEKPVSPNVTTNVIIGMLLGFVAVCGVVVVIELMDDKIHDSDYLTQTFELPVLAVIPDLMQNHGDSSAYHRAANKNKN